MSTLLKLSSQLQEFQIVRVDGHRISISDLELTQKPKEVIEASFYEKLKVLHSVDYERYYTLINEVLSTAFINTNSSKSVDSQNAIKLQFTDCLYRDYPNMTTKEFNDIIKFGIRGKLRDENPKLADPNHDHLSLVNFDRWYEQYEKDKLPIFAQLMNKVNSLPVPLPTRDEMYDKMAKMHVIELNSIIETKKSDPDNFEKKIIQYTSLFPDVLYDLFVNLKYLKSDTYLKFIEKASELVMLASRSFEDHPQMDLVLFLTAKEFTNSKPDKTVQKSKQLAIIHYLKSKNKLSC